MSSIVADKEAPTQNRELQAVKERIRKLLARTTARGCTTEEAMNAAAHAGRLMKQYALSIDEVELRQQVCKLATIDTGMVRITSAYRHMTMLGALFDCRVWSQTPPRKPAARGKRVEKRSTSFKVYGLAIDVDMVVYLNDVIVRSAEAEAKAYAASLDGLFRHSSTTAFGESRKQAVSTFRVTLSVVVKGRLSDMLTEKEAALHAAASSSNALMVVKSAMVDEAFEAMRAETGLRLKTHTRRARWRVTDAAAAGMAAGRRINLGRPLSASPETQRLSS